MKLKDPSREQQSQEMVQPNCVIFEKGSAGTCIYMLDRPNRNKNLKCLL